ncbi:PTS sugar transporter subunit IIA [Weissella bombi]|uniref:PTS system IIA component, Gat family n=1 Tax=Weissella bombi TaxID=1505725 RepID=A0A1C4A6Z5_9LACO|nr:PTS sugar transporter subunit IIA [Weissella bombi]SCB90190.1 PTS system IIA component, Gat family [Weissella bombi]
MLSDKVILLDEPADSDQEALGIMAEHLLKSGAVKESYKPALLQREVDFPTGLATENIGIAMPHTDAEHVNYDQIAFMRLREPVSFLQMGDGVKIQVKFIFMLALKEAHSQLDMLQTLVTLIQDENKIQQLLVATDEDNIVQILKDAGIE